MIINNSRFESKININLNKLNPLDLLYPPVCGICGKQDNNFLCNKCKILLEKETFFGIDNYKINEKYFEEHLYVFMYEGIIRKIILNYKFNEKSYLYKTFSNFLLNNEKIFGKLKSYDIIMPVPISKKRKRQRGYNQCSLIAKEIGKKAGLKYIDNCLYKMKYNKPQSTLNKEERQNNVIGVYKIKNKQIIQDKNILLFDDIYTTGSTVNECCKVLIQAGIKKVGVITLAKD